MDVLITVSPEFDKLTIKYGQSDVVTLVSARSAINNHDSRNALRQLEMDIRASKSKYRDAPSSTQKALGPSDVPGTLLNMALLNLHAQDDALRMAAYALLQEMSTFFRYDSLAQVISVSGERGSLEI